MKNVSPLAGKPAPASLLVNVPRLVTAYYAEHPDPSVASERVAFGTSGHRGSAFERTFNEDHILAITQTICSYRLAHAITGPLFMGIDTHALSEPAFVSALEVLAANDVNVMIDKDLRLHSDTCRLTRHPSIQPGPHVGSRRRHRHHAFAQPAGRRRLQVQSADRRPG